MDHFTCCKKACVGEELTFPSQNGLDLFHDTRDVMWSTHDLHCRWYVHDVMALSDVKARPAPGGGLASSGGRLL